MQGFFVKKCTYSIFSRDFELGLGWAGEIVTNSFFLAHLAFSYSCTQGALYNFLKVTVIIMFFLRIDRGNLSILYISII